MKKLLGAMAVVAVMMSTASAGTIEEAFNTQNELILELAKSHNSAVKEVRRLNLAVSSLSDQVIELRGRLHDTTQRAKVAEEIAISIRSDTFDLKANIVQLEGAIKELRTENKKGWF